MNAYKTFVKRVGLIGITNVLIAISSIILLPLLTKNLSITEYGIWVQIITTSSLIPSIAILGLPYSMVRFLSSVKEKKRIKEEFYSIAFLLFIPSLFALIIMLLCSKYIGAYLLSGNYNVAIILSFIIFVACLNSLTLNYFRTFNQMKKYAFFLFLQAYVNILLIVCFISLGYGILGASIAFLITQIFIFLVTTSLIIKDIGFQIPNFQNAKNYLSFGIPTIPSNLSSWIVDSSDRYVIGILLGTAFVGYYSPGYTLGNIIQMLSVPFSTILLPTLSNHYDKNEKKDLNTLLNYSMKYFLLMAIPAAFGMSILSKQLLLILATPEIAVNGYLITPFVALSALLFGSYNIISNPIILKNKTKIIGIIWIIAAIINLFLNIMVVPYWGIIGAAAVTLISYSVAFIITLYYSSKFFKFNYNPYFIIKSIIASLIMSIIIIRLNPQGPLKVMLTILISVIIYMITLYLMKGIDKKEVKFLKKLFQRTPTDNLRHNYEK